VVLSKHLSSLTTGALPYSTSLPTEEPHIDLKGCDKPAKEATGKGTTPHTQI